MRPDPMEGKTRPYGTTDSVRTVVSHGCEPTLGLPFGTAEPHAKEPVMDEGTTYVGMDVHKRTIAVAVRFPDGDSTSERSRTRSEP